MYRARLRAQILQLAVARGSSCDKLPSDMDALPEPSYEDVRPRLRKGFMNGNDNGGMNGHQGRVSPLLI